MKLCVYLIYDSFIKYRRYLILTNISLYNEDRSKSMVLFWVQKSNLKNRIFTEETKNKCCSQMLDICYSREKLI
jgi:hypothetical protein